MMKISKKVWLTALVFFTVTFFLKSVLIYLSPEANNFTDISCLVNGGQMLTHGINPYDFNDNVELRTQLRLDSIAHNEWLSSDPLHWNYHSGNNLPFNLLLNGFIDLFADGNVYIYRLAYNLADSLISVFVVLFLFGVLQLPFTFINILIAFFLGGASPQLLIHGTLIPGDKGIQILFMIMSIWYAYRKKLLPTALFLSFAVGFKAIGIFFAPICLFYFFSKRSDVLIDNNGLGLVIKSVFEKNNLSKLFVLVATSIAFFLIFYLPYAKDFYNLMLNRLEFDLDNMPLHASLWRFFYGVFPNTWMQIREYSVIALTLYTIWLFLYKKLSFELFISTMLLLFTCILLITGSLERCNMAMQLGCLILLFKSRKLGTLLSLFYIFGAIIYIIPLLYRYINFTSGEWIDYPLYSSYFVLIYCLIYFVCISLYSFNQYATVKLQDKPLT